MKTNHITTDYDLDDIYGYINYLLKSGDFLTVNAILEVNKGR